jgi:hypothetical protein
MKKTLIFAIVVSLLTLSNMAYAGYVRGHYRSNGTYVQGYHRSNPNGTTLDNYSTKGNYNPYTGARGTRNP